MNRTCEERIPAIHMLVEGELGPRETEDLSGHIEHCPRCTEKFEELSEMKSILEEGLDARISLPPEVVTASRAAEAAPQKRSTGAVRRFFKWALIGAAACVAVVIISVAVFLRIYFDRTFPSEITGTVMRASDGILARDDDGDEWAPLRPARRLKRGTLIAMPEKGAAIMSFDGVRVLGDGPAEIRIEGKRRFSLEKGAVHVAAADKRKPLRIALGKNSLKTNDSTLRLDVTGGSIVVDCISGSATLKVPGAGENRIASGQRVSVRGENVQVTAISVEDPFQLAKVTVLERIKKRFDKVISQYAYAPPSAPAKKSMGRAGGGDEGWRFASYVKGEPARYASRRSEASVADYYEKLFSPSNRTITIGRQRAVPVTPGWMASQPSWSHDGSMISFIESRPYMYGGRLRIVSLDDLNNPWDISQEYAGLVIQMLPAVWAPDNRHVIFTAMNDDPLGFNQNYQLKIAPIDPAEGPIRDFNTPFFDIPLPLPIPIGKNFSANILTLPWGDAMLVANWGNLGYIPVEPDGQAVAGAAGFFLTNFNPRKFFSTGGGWSASGSTIDFTAISDLQLNPFECYILFEVEDILDGFTQPPRSRDDPRIKQLAPSGNFQFGSGFSYDESLVFFHEDVNNAFDVMYPIDIYDSDFDLFYANALPGEPSQPTQIHMPGNQMFVGVSPEGNRVVYCNYEGDNVEFRVVSFDIEADMDMDLGGVLIDNSGTNLIVPPGALEDNFSVTISTPFSIGEQAELNEGDNTFFAMRLIDAQGLENPKFIEPMTLTIRYTDEEVEGLDEGMLDIYYYDESDPDNPGWVGLGGTVDPEHNEITVEIQHFSKFSVGGKRAESELQPKTHSARREAGGAGEHLPLAAAVDPAPDSSTRKTRRLDDRMQLAARMDKVLDTSTIVVEEGVGFGRFSVADRSCTKAFIRSRLGDPARERERSLDYTGRYGLSFFFERKTNRVIEIRLNKRFRGSLTSGVSMSSSMDDVFDAYGEPLSRINAADLNTFPGDRTLTRKGESSKIYYQGEGLLFWFKKNRISQIVVFKKEASEEDTSGIVVEEGVGFDGIVIGSHESNLEFIKSRLGEPDEEGGRSLIYTNRYGIDFGLTPNGGPLAQIHLNRGFGGSLSSGISLSSTMDDVFSAYGQPRSERTVGDFSGFFKDEALQRKGNISLISYPERGVMFWFKGDAINQIVVYKARPPEVREARDDASQSWSEWIFDALSSIF